MRKIFMLLIVVCFAGSVASGCAYCKVSVNPSVGVGIKGTEVYVDADDELTGEVEEYVHRAGGVVSTDSYAQVKIEVETFNRVSTSKRFYPFGEDKIKSVSVDNIFAVVKVWYRKDADGREYLLRYRGEGLSRRERGVLSKEVLALREALRHLH